MTSVNKSRIRRHAKTAAHERLAIGLDISAESDAAHRARLEDTHNQARVNGDVLKLDAHYDSAPGEDYPTA